MQQLYGLKIWICGFGFLKKDSGDIICRRYYINIGKAGQIIKNGACLQESRPRKYTGMDIKNCIYHTLNGYGRLNRF